MVMEANAPRSRWDRRAASRTSPAPGAVRDSRRTTPPGVHLAAPPALAVRRWRPDAFHETLLRSAALLFLSAAAVSQRPPAEPETTEEAWHLQRLTGHWFGSRDDLEDQGFTVHLLELGDASVIASGGRETRSTATRWLWELGAEWDLGPRLGLAGWSLAASAQLQRGEDGSLESGDLQVYSNIDGPDRTQLSLLTATYAPDDSVFGVKVGKWDANDDFALVDCGVYHLQSSFGFSPTIVGLPSYPDPAFGGALFLRSERLHVTFASFDGATQAGVATGPRGPRTMFGAPSGWCHLAQATIGDPPDADLPTHARVGVFHHTGAFDDGRGGLSEGATGYFANFEGPLYRPTPQVPDCERHLSGFVQYGYTAPDFSEVEHYLGAGLLWTGAALGRPEDSIGCGVAWADVRNIPGAPHRTDGELACELFYRLQLPRGIVVMPDVQYIFDPGGDQMIEDVLVFTLRIEVDF